MICLYNIIYIYTAYLFYMRVSYKIRKTQLKEHFVR